MKESEGRTGEKKEAKEKEEERGLVLRRSPHLPTLPLLLVETRLFLILLAVVGCSSYIR